MSLNGEEMGFHRVAQGPRGHGRAGARQRARGEKAPAGSAPAPSPTGPGGGWRLFLRTGGEGSLWALMSLGLVRTLRRVLLGAQ